MKDRIYKPTVGVDKDKDVPEFGGYSHDELVYPSVRELSPDLFGNDALDNIRHNALSRALYFAYQIGKKPPIHFPNGEHFQHIPFSQKHWEQYGDMESESSRLRFMLENYPSRRFPATYSDVCKSVLSSENVLKEWSQNIPKVNALGILVFEEILKQMDLNKVHDDYGYSNGQQGAFQSSPVSYESSEGILLLESLLFEKANQQLAEELILGNFDNVPVLLSLYGRVKDPIIPIRSNLAKQSEIFIELYKDTLLSLKSSDLDDQKTNNLMQQLALESSFLALPEVANMSFSIYRGHHELPYINVDITKFPRGEFANPNRALEIVEDMINDSIKFGVPVITPITVSYFQEPQQSQPQLFIIDGNNRATAILVMKYFDYSNYNRSKVFDKTGLRRFVISHNLDIEWERDLVMALKSISEEQVSKLAENQYIVSEFANSKIPALLVQEPNFHTIAVAQSDAEKIVLLQPMHQAIYNQGRFSMAIPSKQQSHGRAAGNDVKVNLQK